jgi:hypothetical protein
MQTNVYFAQARPAHPGLCSIALLSRALDHVARYRLQIAAVAGLIVILLGSASAFGAVGCSLNDPDRDVAWIYPESTGYKTFYVNIVNMGGEKLLKKIEAELGDTFHGLYETIDNPYTVYEIFVNNKKAGYIHGVNQKGQYGGIQVFLALDLNERIKAFYIQRLTSQYARKLRAPAFGKQFIGLTLKDFEQYDVVTGKGTGMVVEIKNPAPKAESDFRAILRATKKNLVLLKDLVYTWKAPSQTNGAASH